MSWKNRALLAIARLFGTRRREPESFKKILVATTTALGDTLWATPALKTLRGAHPQAHIAVLTTSLGREIFLHNPDIDEIILLKKPLALLRSLRKKKFDAALIFHASQRLVLPLCDLARIPAIIGTEGQNKGLDALLTVRVVPRYEHEIARRLRLVACLGKGNPTETLCYKVAEDERRAARDLLADARRPLIAFHPGSKEPFRRWPPSSFATLGRDLLREFGGTVFLTGTPSEQLVLEKLRKDLPQATLLPQQSVRGLAALLEQMDLLVSNDTGPFHLALAVECPAVGLYVSTDPCLCGPYKARRALAIAKTPTCTPCLKRRCRMPFCFFQIAPHEVLPLCRKLLDPKPY